MTVPFTGLNTFLCRELSNNALNSTRFTLIHSFIEMKFISYKFAVLRFSNRENNLC